MNALETVLIIAGGAAAASAVVFAGVKISKNRSGRKEEKIPYKKAAEEFADCADVFSGLYEPLYMMGNGCIKFRTGVIGDWAARTENLINAADYKEMWKNNFSDYADWSQEIGRVKITGLLSFIKSSGVCRDTANQIIVDGTTYKRYGINDDMIEEGNTAKVITPYWFIGDKILEKGIVEKL